MEWEPIYAELANKIRWAISSTGDSAGISYTYRESMAAANMAAGDLLRIMKVKWEKPDFRLTTAKEVSDFCARVDSQHIET